MGTGCHMFIALPAVLVLAGCFGPPDAPDPPVISPASVVAAGACSESGAEAKRPKAREAICLKALGAHASRKGKVLSLKLDDGTAKTFRNNTAGCDDDPTKCEEYFLVGFYSAPGVYLLMVQRYEIYDFTLVNIHTGATREADGVPWFAPDNSTFFDRHCDDTCSISVKSMAASAVWRMSSSEDAAKWEFVRWIDSDRIALKIAPRAERAQRAPDDTTCPQGDCQAILKRTGGSWTIETLPPQSAAR